MRGESTILLILRSAKCPCRQVTLSGADSAERLLEVSDGGGPRATDYLLGPGALSEWCRSNYSGRMLVKPAGRLQQQAPPSLGSRAHCCANYRSTPQHGRGPDGKRSCARQSRAPLCARRLAERATRRGVNRFVRMA